MTTVTIVVSALHFNARHALGSSTLKRILRMVYSISYIYIYIYDDAGFISITSLANQLNN